MRKREKSKIHHADDSQIQRLVEKIRSEKGLETRSKENDRKTQNRLADPCEPHDQSEENSGRFNHRLEILPGVNGHGVQGGECSNKPPGPMASGLTNYKSL